MKHFTYRDSNGIHTGTIYDNHMPQIDLSNIKSVDVDFGMKFRCVLGHHIKLDMILVFIIWFCTSIAFHHGIGFIACLIVGFVYHIIKNIIKLKVCGFHKMN